MRVFTFVFGLALLLQGCSPQAYYITVERNNNAGKVLINRDNIAVVACFDPHRPSSLGFSNDSLIMVNAAVAVAEKTAQDRELVSGIDSISLIPVALNSKLYAQYADDPAAQVIYRSKTENSTIAKRLGNAKTLIIVENAGVDYTNPQNEIKVYDSELYGITFFSTPVKISFKVYDNILGSYVYGKEVKDTMQLELQSSNLTREQIVEMTEASLSQIAYRLGESAAAELTPQWIEESHLLVTYKDSKEWMNACQLAEEYKLKEAIDAFMPFTESNNPRKVSFAAYDIAVLCNILGQKELALKWITLSMERFKFKEAVSLYKQLHKSEQ